MALRLQVFRGKWEREVEAPKERTVAFLSKHRAGFVDLCAPLSVVVTAPFGWKDANYYSLSMQSCCLADGPKTAALAKGPVCTGLFVLVEAKNVGR